MATYGQLLRQTLVACYKDNILGIAKGAAYSALLSFFPVLTSLTAILIQANAHAVSRNLSAIVFSVVPPGTEDIVRYNFTERGQRPLMLLVVAVLVSIWAASGVMMSLMEGFRAAYKIPEGRPFWPQRGMAALLVIVAALPVVIASALIVFGSRVELWILLRIGILEAGERLAGSVYLVSQIIRILTAVAAIVMGTSFLYYLGPNRPRRLRSVYPGAIVATALWWLATTLFGWYVRNIANYNVLYGSVGAVIALLVWMYLLSIIALFGCELNAQLDRNRTAQS
ncbi:MAG TPA: YihY/virulence factor BrkB family protein [Bryobacteraceae bacterium]|nr:YihY/virulence factor BrkB family protein [Bryobacteraceae bacterium]